jgi:hypothetical protein
MTIVIMKGASYNFVECEAIVILNCISQRKVSILFVMNESVYKQWKELSWIDVEGNSYIVIAKLVNQLIVSKILKQEYRYLREGSNYSVKSDDSEVSITVENLVILVTEGEKRI